MSVASHFPPRWLPPPGRNGSDWVGFVKIYHFLQRVLYSTGVDTCWGLVEAWHWFSAVNLRSRSFCIEFCGFRNGRKFSGLCGCCCWCCLLLGCAWRGWINLLSFSIPPLWHCRGKINMFAIFCFLYTVLLLEIKNLAKTHLFSCAPNR